LERVVEDVACTICGCVCDDLRITVRGERIVKAERACELAEPWFLSQGDRKPPVAEISGEPATLDEALARATEILGSAQAPLIYGLSRSSTPGQREAVRLADRLGATIDTTASLCHAPSIMALQDVGESTASLGETRHRADLVIFWGSNPVRSHPRHFERYSLDPPGMFLPRGRADRTLVVVDVEPTDSSKRADMFIQVEPGRDFEALWTLRALVHDRPLDPQAATGAPLEQLVELARKMKTCRCGVVFFGTGLTKGASGHCHVEALLRLVTELNAFTRFHAKRMRIYGDVAGADSVLCWQTGFPFGVNLARGYPRYSPGEYTANGVLGRGETDACLLLGSEGVRGLSPEAMQHLLSIPTIALDYAAVESFIPPTVRFTTAVYGIHLPGTAYRMDEIPIPLRAVLASEYPSDEDVLRGICDRLA
jgi:formylmethanofuran dehydrogenase subunit B